MVSSNRFRILDLTEIFLADGSAGGAISGDGESSRANPNRGEFVDEVIADGFTNPVGMAFTDNTNELFVITKEVSHNSSH